MSGRGGAPTPDHDVAFGEAVRVWAYVGFNSFGGPAGQIAVMHRELIERRRWISERRFLHALNYCMVLPGPEAQQLATYIGWLMHGVRGGVAAGSLFVVPGFVAMMALSIAYATLGDIRAVSGLFAGLQAAVVVLVVQACLRISRRTLTTTFLRVVAAVSFLAIFLLGVPFPAIIAAAALAGLAFVPARAGAGSGAEPELHASTLLADDSIITRQQSRSALRAAVVFALLWAVPVVALVVVLGTESIFTQQALLFSKAAVVTFGGAYAVLGYVAQQAVERYDWISAQDMATGLGLAETTPGPLILVVQFVGFVAAYHQPGPLPPLVAGVVGAVITVWVTFVPCFLFIFLGAPYAERLRENTAVARALTAISAAVAGVILNLALWFALTTAFGSVDEVVVGPVSLPRPDWATLDWSAVAIAGVAAGLVVRFRVGTLKVLGICALLGAVAEVVVAS